jgi:hypothetical protein
MRLYLICSLTLQKQRTHQALNLKVSADSVRCSNNWAYYNVHIKACALAKQLNLKSWVCY